MQIEKKLKKVLNLRVARAIFFAIMNSQNLTLKIKQKEEEFILTLILRTNKEVEILSYIASNQMTATPNAYSALRDLTIEMGIHISKRQIEELVKLVHGLNQARQFGGLKLYLKKKHISVT